MCSSPTNRADGALNLAAILETAADIAKAMVHMHAANVLHSDLKVGANPQCHYSFV